MSRSGVGQALCFHQLREGFSLQEPFSDVVASQYARWPYPEPIFDLPVWLADNWQWFDPSHAHRLLWPDRTCAGEWDILVAGCGANQGAVFAYTNPGAHVVAMDVSGPSLDHHRFLKDGYGLSNLELHHLPIEEAGTLNRKFDLVICTGVLHHLADPKEGMRALAHCLRADGVAALMLYARYGRAGVEILQALFRDLGLKQDEASIRVVKDTLAVLPKDHPVQGYLGFAPDLQFDAGLVDTFLHGRDRSYTVDDCLELLGSAGLVFQDWFLKSPYYPSSAEKVEFHRALAALPREKQWSLMERINTRNPCHFFMACHPERPRHAYRIDFSMEASMNYVPSFRHRCGLDGGALFRPGWHMKLEQPSLALMLHMDGHRSIREIVAKARSTNALPENTPDPIMDDVARNTFRSLWERDFLAMEL
jgi:SAM-dependent methyltransferase